MPEIFYPEREQFLPSKKMYLLRAGFKGTEYTLDRKMRIITNDAYLNAMKIVRPEIKHETVLISELENISIPGKFIGIAKITLFVSTMGETIDKQIEAYYKNGETTMAILTDAWASEAVEELNEGFDRLLRQNHKKGTMRFSPGYGDVDIKENIKILEFLKYKKVRAHPKSGMLIPQKSTVCMIGWY